MKTELYALMYQRGDGFWLSVGIKKIVTSLLNKHLPQKKNNKILDVGCGPGNMFTTLAAYGQVYGVDKSSEAIHYARMRNIAKEVKQANVDHLPFADHTFDAVACFDVLYHKWIENDVAVLKEINRVLVPGGMVVVKEASYDWLRSQHDQLNWTKHRFYKGELVEKLRQADFTIQKSSYIIFFLFPLALIKRLFERIHSEKNPLDNFLRANPFVNNFLKIFLMIEARLITFLNFPFGLSIICIARKKQR